MNLTVLTKGTISARRRNPVPVGVIPVVCFSRGGVEEGSRSPSIDLIYEEYQYQFRFNTMSSTKVLCFLINSPSVFLLGPVYMEGG